MSGIIPNQGVTVRDMAGNCIDGGSAEGTYCPLPAFRMSCALMALPSNCSARLEPVQVNAIVSEMLALAEALSPDGAWDCDSVTNLADIWRSGAWMPPAISPCNAPGAEFDLTVSFLVCNDDGLHRMPLDLPVLAQALTSSDEGNALVAGTDGLLYVQPTSEDFVTQQQLDDRLPATGLTGRLVSYNDDEDLNTQSYLLRGAFATTNVPDTPIQDTVMYIAGMGPSFGNVPGAPLGLYLASESATSYAVAKRTSTGHLRVPTGATENSHAASKSYVDQRLSPAQRTAINALTAIASPSTATAEDCANKINAIINALKA